MIKDLPHDAEFVAAFHGTDMYKSTKRPTVYYIRNIHEGVWITLYAYDIRRIFALMGVD